MHEEYGKIELSDYDYLMSIKQIHDDIMYRELQELSKAEGIEEGVLEERKRNLALFIRQVLSSDDVTWLDQCSGEQLSYGLNIILACKSLEEFKDKVLSYSSNHLGSLNK